MTKPSKLYVSLMANPSRLTTFRDFERLLGAFEFRLDRVEGSHRQYVHPKVPRSFPVQPAKGGKDAKRYQIRQFLDMVMTYELSMDE